MNYKLALAVLLSCLIASGASGQGTPARPARTETFSTPQEAANALINAAEKFDVGALEKIFGPDAKDIIYSGEPARDQELAKQFAEQAREKMDVSVDPKTGKRAFIS